MDPGVSVEVTEATGDIMPVGLAVLAPGVGEHVDVVQGVGAPQPVLDHGRHLHRVLLTGVESLEGGDDTDQTGGGVQLLLGALVDHLAMVGGSFLLISNLKIEYLTKT